MLTILDGPVGTELIRQGVKPDEDAWLTGALDTHSDIIGKIHGEYAANGATVHTTNTFRTQERTVGERWSELTHRAVEIARQSVPDDHRVAGSIAPLRDCYRPELSPSNPGPEHDKMACALAAAGCDLLLVETFANVREAACAATAALETQLETWVAFTSGPDNSLMTPDQVGEAAKELEQLGVNAVLINCVPAPHCLDFVLAIADRVATTRIGVYANAGHQTDGLGWNTDHTMGAKRYSEYAKEWISAGASIVGGCCGTSPEHTSQLSKLNS